MSNQPKEQPPVHEILINLLNCPKAKGLSTAQKVGCFECAMSGCDPEKCKRCKEVDDEAV